MKLFDGAHVLLRNGEECQIQVNTNAFSRFPWVSDDKGGQRRTWTAEGRYTEARGVVHTLDIVSVTDAAIPDDKGDPDLFSSFPYAWDGGVWPAGVKFRVRNGDEFDGLTFLGDEIFTSQRDYVWEKVTGKCFVCPLDGRMAHHTDFDIMSVLVPKAPTELAEFVNENMGRPYIPEEELKTMTVEQVDAIERKGKRIKINWDALDEPDYKETHVYRGGDDITGKIDKEGYFWIEHPAEPYADYVPGKHLMRMMKSMAKSLGGEFHGYMWVTTSKITFHVLFKNTLRKGSKKSRLVQYMKAVTIEVTGCDNNAILPMKKVK